MFPIKTKNAQQNLLENYHFYYIKYSEIFILFKKGSTSALLQLLILLLLPTGILAVNQISLLNTA